jgi:hypothetical protein
MMKRILCAVLVLVAMAVVPVMMAGCNENSRHTSSSYEQQNQPAHQDTVVD